MAKANYYSVINFSGQALTVKINGVETTIEEDGRGVNLLAFDSTATSFPLTIEQNGNTKNINDFQVVSDGKHSFSTFVFTDNGMVNVFPSNLTRLITSTNKE